MNHRRYDCRKAIRSVCAQRGGITHGSCATCRAACATVASTTIAARAHGATSGAYGWFFNHYIFMEWLRGLIVHVYAVRKRICVVCGRAGH